MGGDRERAASGGERLQKVMAAAGVGSRRFCESLIAEGRVAVDGEVVAQPGARVPPGTVVEVDGRPLGPKPGPAYYILNKPTGYVTTMKDTHGRPAIPDLLRAAGIATRLFPVGRLDRDTEGLLLLTNDGELAHAVMHPRHGVEKTYLAWVRGTPVREELVALRGGVTLEEGRTAPARVRLLGPEAQPDVSLVELIIHEGHKRQVRRMMEVIGHPVVRLVRVAVGGLTLEGMAPGAVRALTGKEVAGLRQAAGLTACSSRSGEDAGK